MPVEFHAATPIEVYTITAADYGIAVAVGMVLALVAAVLGAWVIRLGAAPEQPPAEPDSRESAETVELQRRRTGPRTGSLHGPVYRRSDDETIVIPPAETRR